MECWDWKCMTGRGSDTYSKVNSPNRSVEKPLEIGQYKIPARRSTNYFCLFRLQLGSTPDVGLSG
jgi:hypothetical protein